MHLVGYSVATSYLQTRAFILLKTSNYWMCMCDISYKVQPLIENYRDYYSETSFFENVFGFEIKRKKWWWNDWDKSVYSWNLSCSAWHMHILSFRLMIHQYCYQTVMMMFLQCKQLLTHRSTWFRANSLFNTEDEIHIIKYYFGKKCI